MSLSLMRECAYDSAFMFKYSERPGTYASKHLPDDVPEEVKIRRLNEMIELQNQLSAESNARNVGKTFEVLVEGISKRSKEQLFGRTEQNKVVVFDRGTHRIGRSCTCAYHRIQFCYPERYRSNRITPDNKNKFLIYNSKSEKKQ